MQKDKKTIIDITQDPGLHKKSIVQPMQPKPLANNPKLHWIRDKIDPRDYKYQVTNKVQANSVDLRSFCSPIEDQGNLGSCTGNAVAGAIELLNKRNKKQTDVSRLFIYYYERLLEGTVNYDSGAYIRDGIKACYKYGASLESLWPYNIKKFRSAPNAIAVADGSKRKIKLYQRIADHDGCLDALNAGYPIIIGFDVYQSFMTSTVAYTGMMQYPNTKKERLLGGHAVLLVGYDKTTQRYIARNSWGIGWGDKGYFYMPFSVIQNSSMSDDFWVINEVNNP